MNATLSLVNSTLAYGDVPATSNPTRKYFDYGTQRSIAVVNPKSETLTVDPGATSEIFSGLRTTAVAANTEFTLTLSNLASDRYRFTWTAGTNPGLRTNRSLTPAGSTITIAVNSNQTVAMTTSAVAAFAAVVVGDTVFIPGLTTGDVASPFNTLNEGYWVVLAKDITNSILQLARPTGASFLAAAEAVAVIANASLQAFAAAGIQVGDSVDVSAGFDQAVLKKYVVVAVNPKWFEVISTLPLPVGVSATPGSAGIHFYYGAKRYVRIEADQECTLLLNGDAGDSNRLTPWVAGDPDMTAPFEKVGPCWSLSVVNRSSEPLQILFISAE